MLLITVWLEVRVLPGPPRTHSNWEVSQRLANSPQLAGFCVGVSVSPDTVLATWAISAGLSLAPQIPVPRCSICKKPEGCNHAAVDRRRAGYLLPSMRSSRPE